jgi:ABC-type uncharacterized transport system substrate-binding protein
MSSSSGGGSASGFTEHAAAYVDRIFKGANPAALPVARGTIFELAINLKTAKTFGRTIRRSWRVLITSSSEAWEASLHETRVGEFT